MSATAQSTIIKGRVADETGKPLSNVSVLVKGTTAGTITDDNGNYTLAIEAAGSKLIFTLVGYAEVEKPADMAKDVILPAIKNNLDSVVVVGYGSMRKKDVTGSVSSVKATDLLARPVTNALEGLQGRVAGVDIALNSGSPTGSPSVIIRGIGSINSSTDPLYVVDGVAMTNIQYLNLMIYKM
ncbi:carboxypeptidase-like regulatory domain-containing protein [Danxiaibacter flavus]|uniref:Carboxypeptidase-like regulatory domain-containing protein n=1 Tax=Danxiaibacter flavus TaxID=3049108 RepID=A0ABV3ZGQ7_9BACT|nr:carboxypeptidase-like regulatory domain-containing protein [Chitinophagaceae bacterium DXS]